MFMSLVFAQSITVGVFERKATDTLPCLKQYSSSSELLEFARTKHHAGDIQHAGDMTPSPEHFPGVHEVHGVEPGILCEPFFVY